tara:strand:- start:27 stop:869 length:843 start_codon:yes stop_codon:yes gene_type:complete
MGSPFKQKTQSFFGANNTNIFGLDDFTKATNKTVSNLPTFNYRGKNAYQEVINNGVKAPYVKAEGTNKKFPYLSSKHHTGNVVNGMETSVRNTNATTIAEDIKSGQDRMLGGDFAEEGQGSRGSSFFGGSFNKDSEKQAKIAVKKHEYLLNAASQGEQSLKAALDPNREVKNKFGVTVKVGSLVDELFPMSYQKSGSAKNLDGSYAANPAGQSSSNVNDFQALADAATAAQNTADATRRGFYDIENKIKNIKKETEFEEFDPRFISKPISSTGFDPKSGA